MNYLPEGFESLAVEKSYINLSKLQEGEFKFRILKRPIGGWIDWKDKKPYRYRPDNKPNHSFDEEKPMKPFWACYVWDYQKEGLYILDINQMGVIKALTELGKDEDWGDFTNYDIKIKKQGSGKETKYTVQPSPHKTAGNHLIAALNERPVRLEALYEGKDPWLDLEGFETVHHRADAKSHSLLDDLKEALELDGLDVEQLEEFIAERAVSKKQPAEKLIESALLPTVLPLFKEMFAKWLSNQPAAA